MASVYGTAITEATLKALPGFEGKKITLKDKARVAMERKHSEDRDVRVREHCEKILSRTNLTKAVTVCLIYNATGEPISLVTYQNWSGRLDGYTPYPTFIENGQWGVFLHVGDVESRGAIVYRGKNVDSQDRDWMLAWANNTSTKINKVYSEIRGVGHWKLVNDPLWAVVNKKLGDSGLMNDEINEGGRLIISIGNATACSFEAIPTLPN